MTAADVPPRRPRLTLVAFAVLALAAAAAAAAFALTGHGASDPAVSISYTGGFDELVGPALPSGHAPRRVERASVRFTAELRRLGIHNQLLRLHDLRDAARFQLSATMRLTAFRGSGSIVDTRPGRSCRETLHPHLAFLDLRGAGGHRLLARVVAGALLDDPSCTAPLTPAVYDDESGHLHGQGTWSPPSGLATSDHLRDVWFPIDLDRPAETVPVSFTYTGRAFDGPRRRVTLRWRGTVTVRVSRSG